jgi:protein-tyrosine-phosphatase
MAMTRPYHVLFLCTGNSARSILAEALLNTVGAGRFRAFSAGSQPAGRVHPLATELIRQRGLRADDPRSKSWDEFAGDAAPPIDFVFTVCDNAAGEVCPVWPGRPMTAHWGVPDPAAVTGSPDEKRRAFAEALQSLSQRISLFVDLPLEELDRMRVQERLDAIGRMGGRGRERVAAEQKGMEP